MPSYQASARDPGVTLRAILMSHTATVESAGFLTNVSGLLRAQASCPDDLPVILGEGNSIAGQDTPGLPDTFGAALWVSPDALMPPFDDQTH